jgi:hypothetical protein
LEYPFLFTFNPQIDWKKGDILGPATKISTIGFKQAHRLLRRFNCKQLELVGDAPRKGKPSIIEGPLHCKTWHASGKEN